MDQVLVNNAARGMPGYKATEHTRAHFEEVFGVNVSGVVDTISECIFHCSYAGLLTYRVNRGSPFVPLLSRSSSPRIVNVSSGAGSLGLMSSLPEVGGTVYSTSYAYDPSVHSDG